MQSSASDRPSRRRMLGALAAGLLLATAAVSSPAHAQQESHPADSGFSFAVYGDSRSMMNLPYKSDQEAEARKLMVDMFELVLPEKVSEAIVEKDVKLTYDPALSFLNPAFQCEKMDRRCGHNPITPTKMR
jgi:hypothetical protein